MSAFEFLREYQDKTKQKFQKETIYIMMLPSHLFRVALELSEGQDASKGGGWFWVVVVKAANDV